MIPVAIALALGCAAALCVNFEQRVLVAIVLGSLCAWSAIVPSASARLRAAVVLALACGFLVAHAHTQASPNINQTRTNHYEATVLTCAPIALGSECGLTLQEGLVVLAYFARGAPPIAERIVVRGRITPFDAPRNPGEPDERLLQSERGYAAALQEAVILRDLGRAPVDARSFVALAQAAAGARLRAFLDEPYASIVAGEVWGERAAIPPDLRAEFQDSGTVHVLVTAGLHLGVIAMLVLGGLAWLRVPRRGACIVAALILWCYVGFSGAHLPAIRAGAMITFALAARAAGAKTLSWNAVACAAIVVLLISPASILSASFAMSFSCVASIVLLAPIIESWLLRGGLFPAPIAEVVTLTVATQIGVWPLTASTFLLFSPYAVLANAAVVPVVGATMILGGLQILCAPAAPLAHAVANLNTCLLTWMLSVIRMTAELPHAHIVMTPPPLWAIAVYDASLFAIVWLYSRRAYTAAAAILSFAIFNILSPPQHFARDLQITVLDVGQADAIAIRTPAGHVFLVDAGGRLERGAHTAADSVAEHVGETVVVPFLVRNGIHHIDALLLSHPHGDHAGGTAPVLRALGADRFADTGQQYGGFAYHDALSVLQKQHTPVVYPRAGMVWHTNDGVTLTFLGPQVPFITGSRNDINNNSLVFMLQYKAFRMLFTGDAGAEAEQRMLGEGIDLHADVPRYAGNSEYPLHNGVSVIGRDESRQRGVFDIDVLKVGHHGSAYSSSQAFIDAVRPRYAIISVGRHNLFGHPAPSTLQTLQQVGAIIYRTDEDGAITVDSDGQGHTTVKCALNSCPQ